MAPSVSGRAGYVYLLSNPSMPGLVKIGRTTRDPARRAGELTSASGVPTPFKLEGYIRTEDAVRTEAEIHRRMAAERVNRRREFFRADPGQALVVARTVANAEKSKFSNGGTGLSGSSGLIQILALALYANALLWICGLDFGELWKPAAANAAMALLMPGRYWKVAARLLSRRPFVAHIHAFLILAAVALIARGMDPAATLRSSFYQIANF